MGVTSVLAQMAMLALFPCLLRKYWARTLRKLNPGLLLLFPSTVQSTLYEGSGLWVYPIH